MGRTVQSTPAVVAGRRTKAMQFATAAEMIAALADDAVEVADAYVTLLVHAGIAAADVMCCIRLGEHAAGDSHNDAVALLNKIDKACGKALGTLLAAKTKAGYGAATVSYDDRVRCERACARLIDGISAL